MRITLFVLAFFCLFTSYPGQAAEKIVIPGTGDSQLLLRDLARAYEKGHPGTSIEVPDTVGSSGGIRLVASGKAELGRVARPLWEDEKDNGMQYRQFGLVPVVFATHPDVVGVGNLTDLQVVSIYSGKIKNWRELGGQDKPILVANREPGDSSRTILEQKVPHFEEIGETAGKTIYSTPETAATIGSYPNTIGYLPLSAAKGIGLKILAYNGIDPSVDNVRQGRYPLSVPLGIVWKGKLNGLAADFLEYLTGREAGEILKAHGVVPTL